MTASTTLDAPRKPLATLAVAALLQVPACAVACGAITPCDVNNGQPIDDGVCTSPDPETAVTGVRARSAPFPIVFVGDDHKSGGAYTHVSILGIKTDGIAYYSQAPVANVDVSVLAPTFSGPSRRIVPVTVGGAPASIVPDR